MGVPQDVVIQEISTATGYLIGFLRGEQIVFENYADERNVYNTVPGSSGTRIYKVPSAYTSRFKPACGSNESANCLSIYVRALINNQWTNAAVVPIKLQ